VLRADIGRGGRAGLRQHVADGVVGVSLRQARVASVSSVEQLADLVVLVGPAVSRRRRVGNGFDAALGVTDVGQLQQRRPGFRMGDAVKPTPDE
jgi:hypothetical protein